MDRRPIPDKLISKHRTLFPTIKRFWEWQLRHLGGGRSFDMAEGSALQVRDFFQYYGVFKLGFLNPKHLESYISHLEKEKKKPASIQFSVRAIKFLDYLL